ncbi:hypothetical protein GCM10027167_07200 [Nocardia heshunensis]
MLPRIVAHEAPAAGAQTNGPSNNASSDPSAAPLPELAMGDMNTFALHSSDCRRRQFVAQPKWIAGVPRRERIPS